MPDLVNAALDLLIDGEAGIWHLANAGEITWADFANEIAGRFQLKRSLVNAISNEEMNYAAQRPPYTALSSSRGIMLPTLEDALHRFTNEAPTIQKESVKEFRA